MTSQATTTDKLRSVLLRLVDEKTLSTELITSAYNYLFCKVGTLPFFADTELCDAVSYLEDIMTANGLQEVDDILAFFEKKRRSLVAFIDNIKIENNDDFLAAPEHPVQWQKPDSEQKIPRSSSDDGLYWISCCTTKPALLLPAPVGFNYSCVVLLPAPRCLPRAAEPTKEESKRIYS